MAKTPREKYLEIMGFTEPTEGKGDNINTAPIKAALDRAHEIRIFEIGMLWKRALYFWGFQGVILIALGGVLNAASPQCCEPASVAYSSMMETAALLLSLVGFLTAFGLVLMNKGSKHWQENWEFHIDMLEEGNEGNLHKTILRGGGSRVFSVSKLNQRTSEIFAVFWLIVLSIIGLWTAQIPMTDVYYNRCFLIGIIGIFFVCGTIYLWRAKGNAGGKKTVTFKQREIESISKEK